MEQGMDVLKAALASKTPARLYVFYGEEVFLLHHYLDRLHSLLTDELTESFNCHRLNNENFTVEGFLNAVEGLPMMAEHTFVRVDEVDLFRLPEADRERLAAAFRDIPDYCTVVFCYETVVWKPDKRSKKLYGALEEFGSWVEFPRQEQRDLIPWISRHFAARKKRISTQLCAYLVELTGGGMTALAGEIDKIAAYSGAEEIIKSDIDAVTEPVLDAVVFQMTDLLGQGEYGKALVKLRQLLQMQQEPVAILGAVGGHIRRLGAARTLLDNGKGAGELSRLYGLKDYAARKTMGAARQFSARFCAAAAELVLETDNRMKTSFDEPDRLLEMLILNLSREARNG